MAQKYRLHPTNLAFRALCKDLGYTALRASDVLNRPEKAVKNWFQGVSRPTQEAIVLLRFIKAVPELQRYIDRRETLHD